MPFSPIPTTHGPQAGSYWWGPGSAGDAFYPAPQAIVDIGPNPNGWTQILFGDPPPPPPPVIPTSVSPALIAQDGGVELVATGTFPAGVDLAVYLGLAGDTTDPACWGGHGYGMAPQSSDGTTLHFWAPRFIAGEKGNLTLTIAYGGDTYTLSAAVMLAERVWRSKQFSMRASFPPWAEVGQQLHSKGRL